MAKIAMPVGEGFEDSEFTVPWPSTKRAPESGACALERGLLRRGGEPRREAMPRQAWSDKDERQYRHVEESARERGRSPARAKEIAARTVNKQRREEGRTRSGRKTTSGTGNPNRSLEERTVAELRNRAAELDVEGRSRMSKQELLRAIRGRR